MKIERRVKALNPHERAKIRKEEATEILEEIKLWLDAQKLSALPKSPPGKGVTYALNNWLALTKYTKDGDLSIDNNCSERALRATAVGLKNWLFMGSVDGGKSAAIITSLIATCKAHNIHPRNYLSDVLTRQANGAQNIDFLLPLAS